ncbi:MAG: hypothetical protein R2697_03765 [Ilumatobacteraceae bacterium]
MQAHPAQAGLQRVPTESHRGHADRVGDERKTGERRRCIEVVGETEGGPVAAGDLHHDGEHAGSDEQHDGEAARLAVAAGGRSSSFLTVPVEIGREQVVGDERQDDGHDDGDHRQVEERRPPRSVGEHGAQAAGQHAEAPQTVETIHDRRVTTGADPRSLEVHGDVDQCVDEDVDEHADQPDRR